MTFPTLKYVEKKDPREIVNGSLVASMNNTDKCFRNGGQTQWSGMRDEEGKSMRKKVIGREKGDFRTRTCVSVCMSTCACGVYEGQETERA